MTFLVDTSVIIEFLRGNSKTFEFFSSKANDSFITSCVCVAEILEGVYREKTQENIALRKKEVEILFKSFYKIIAFDSDEADMAGQIRADLGKRGEKIEDLDVFIAATALKNDATLWTKNPKHFSKIRNLQVALLE